MASGQSWMPVDFTSNVTFISNNWSYDTYNTNASYTFNYSALSFVAATAWAVEEARKFKEKKQEELRLEARDKAFELRVKLAEKTRLKYDSGNWWELREE